MLFSPLFRLRLLLLCALSFMSLCGWGPPRKRAGVRPVFWQKAQGKGEGKGMEEKRREAGDCIVGGKGAPWSRFFPFLARVGEFGRLVRSFACF